MITVKQAVLLAAGRGSRMGKAGADRPKALLEIAGSSLLDSNLRALVAAGIERLVVVSGWQAQRLEDALQAHPLRQRFSVEFRHNPRWRDTGPMRSLMQADDSLLSAPTLMLYGDCAYAARTLTATLAAYRGGLCVPGDRLWSALWSLRFEHPLLDAERWRSRADQLLEIGGRATVLDQEMAQFMGLCLFDPPAWRRCMASIAHWQSQRPAEVDRADLTALLARRLAEGEPIACTEIYGGWIELDCARDREQIEQAMRSADSGLRTFSHDVRR